MIKKAVCRDNHSTCRLSIFMQLIHLSLFVNYQIISNRRKFPKKHTVVLKKTLDVFEKTLDVFKNSS